MFHPITAFLTLLSVLTGLVVLHLDASSLCLIAILSIVAAPALRTTRVRRWLWSVYQGWLQGWQSRANAGWKWIRSRLPALDERASLMRFTPHHTAVVQQQDMQAARLCEAIKELGEDLDTFTRDWSEDRALFYQRNQLALPEEAPPLPHQHLLYAFMALEHALAHLASNAHGARTTTDDLAFYQDWVSGLRLQLQLFVDRYAEQQSYAQEALREAKQDHATLADIDQEAPQERDYQHAEGVLAILEYVLYDGSVHPASVLPLIEANQRRIKARLTNSLAYPF